MDRGRSQQRGGWNRCGFSVGLRGSRNVALLLVPVLAVLSVGVPAALSTTRHRARTSPSAAATPPVFRPGVVLLAFRSGVSSARRHAIERGVGGRADRRLGPSIRAVGHGRTAGQEFLAPFELRIPARQVLAVVRRLRRNREVAYAEPDYPMLGSATPNDPSFALQWGDSNTGQPIPGQGSEEVLGPEAPGAPGADDGAVRAWGKSTGSRSIVIGETDTGVDVDHPDLAANIWSNPGGIGGCPAGTHGYDVLSRSCDAEDEDAAYGGHGTHVAGILGALGNNGAGVAGINWQTTILPVKWMQSASYGTTSALIEALQWLVAAKQAGVNVRVVNDSDTFVGTASSQALANEIDTLGANNILFVTAAGNTGDDNDVVGDQRYPCSYDRPTEICVTASDHNDQLPGWANYGPHTVNLAAPGVSIYSTLGEGGYGYLSGGSMAAPQVAGAAALILSEAPSLSAAALKADILENVDKLPSLSGKVTTQGRLDVCKALPGCEAQSPPRTWEFGKTTVGASTDRGIFANYKVVHSAALTVRASVSKLSLYAVPGIGSPNPQVVRAVIYSDAGGSPGTLVASGTQVTYRGASSGAGWLELPFASPVTLAPGTYWLGFIAGGTSDGIGYAYDSVPNSRAYNANEYSRGPTSPFGAASLDSEQASIYATYTATGSAGTSPPVNSSRPAISGVAQAGQTLSASTGTWTESPSGFSFQWQRCGAGGASCSAIALATAQTYTAVAADVGSTLRVAVTASNSAGASAAPASSLPTAVVGAGSASFGKTSLGASSDAFAANRKRVSRYTLPTAGSVTKLSIYLLPGAPGRQALEGVLYADSGGAPGALLETTNPLTFESTNAAGWYDLTLPSPVKLGPGSYWIGVITGATGYVARFRYDAVTGGRDVNSNLYGLGPSNPFGSATIDNEQTSLYATYTPE